MTPLLHSYFQAIAQKPLLCWPHRNLAENPALGRHYVATRHISIGEIILKDEEPLIAGPMNNSVPVCLKCYTVLNEDIATPCTTCGWPLCQKCKEHGLECNFTSSRRGDKVSITKFGYPHPSYQCINVIRALSLKTTNAEVYNKLMSLESHCDRIKDKENFIFEEPLNTARFIKRFFRTDDVSEEEITKIIGILQVNGHEVPITEPPYVAVYELASLLEHNCRANCSKSFTDTGGLIIHAAIPITKGDNISICYTDPLWGTANRIHHLSKTKFFECICDRCKDPTEFGTMFDALKCNQMNCSGYMLPKTFLAQSQEDYACNICKSIISYEEAEKILEDIAENRIRGLILFELHAALAEYSRRHVEMDTLTTLLLESKKCLLSAHQLLRYEPKVLPEGFVVQQAEKNLQQMNKLLKQFNVE
ncbi:unnamed protein product [Xylocopa violacea]|uniref:SET domain-containing protein n=1 Tax=Xylocopa violacea TaxID=135666 RepID=A0ABP1P817_XYLVO